MKTILFFILAIQVVTAQELAPLDISKSIHIITKEADVPLPQETPEYSRYLDNIKGALFGCRFCQHILYEKGLRPFHSHLDDVEQVKKILKLALEIRQKEDKYPNYYSLITAQTSHYFAYQVIAKELYQRLSKQKRENFEFLRYPGSYLTSSLDDFFHLYPHMMIREFDDILTETDVNPEVGRQILSTNLSLETHHAYDSALWIFLEGKGAARLGLHGEVEIPSAGECFKSHLFELFGSAGITKEQITPYIGALIAKAPVMNEGIINQIFIPKKRIKEFAYVSFSAGFLNAELNQDIDATIAAFQSDRMQEDPSNDNLQFRVLAGKLFDDDVLIFRYSLISEKDQKDYQKLVSDVLDKILPVE